MVQSRMARFFRPIQPPWKMSYRYVEASGHPGALAQILSGGITPRDAAGPFIYFSANFFRFQVEAEEFLALPGRAEAAVYVDLREYPDRLEWKPTNPLGRHRGGGLECEFPVRSPVPPSAIVEHFELDARAEVASSSDPREWGFLFRKA